MSTTESIEGGGPAVSVEQRISESLENLSAGSGRGFVQCLEREIRERSEGGASGAGLDDVDRSAVEQRIGELLRNLPGAYADRVADFLEREVRLQAERPVPDDVDESDDLEARWRFTIKRGLDTVRGARDLLSRIPPHVPATTEWYYAAVAPARNAIRPVGDELDHSIDFFEPSPEWLWSYTMSSVRLIRGAVRLLDLIDADEPDNELESCFFPASSILGVVVGLLEKVCVEAGAGVPGQRSEG